MYIRQLFNQLLVFLVFFAVFLNNANSDSNSVLYEVKQAFLNVKHCDVRGEPVEYASKYLRLSQSNTSDSSYEIVICDGESIEELSCSGRFSRSILNEVYDGSLVGQNFSARTSQGKDGMPQCMLTALQRKVIPMKGGIVRYSRADWGTLLADYNYECTVDTAKLFFEAQSLQCSTYIVIDANVVHADTFSN